jgi:valyl-tRNA synthetase
VDRAVVAELRPLLERATQAFDSFDYAQALGMVEDFFWRVFCDNYLEIAKPRTYDEALTAERLSACATLRLLHRCLVRLLAPFVPYITEEVWQWAYAGDSDMKPSVHTSPWPSLAELATIPEPNAAGLWATTVEVVDLLRKAKADASKSLAAPLASADIIVKAGNVPALESALDDIKRMLRVGSINVAAGDGEDFTPSVQVVFEEITDQT